MMETYVSRTCAVCGRTIRKADLCNLCFHRWCPGGIAPLWVTELIVTQHSFETNYAAFEIPFSNDDRDISGEKLRKRVMSI